MKKTYKGIDVSLYQGEIDFNAVKNDGIDFAIIKSSQGAKRGISDRPFTDPRFIENIKKAINVKGEFYTGVYHYFTAISDTANEREISYVLNLLKPYKDYLPLWVAIDVEDNVLWRYPREQLNRYLKRFCDELKNNGFRPMIYGSTWYIDNWITVSSVPIWEANYSISKFPERAKIWQCGTGNVKGVSGAVDINFAHDIIGDVNGDGEVNARDVIDLMKHIITPKTPIDKGQADINRDGKVNARDVLALMKRA